MQAECIYNCICGNQFEIKVPLDKAFRATCPLCGRVGPLTALGSTPPGTKEEWGKKVFGPRARKIDEYEQHGSGI